MKSPAALRLRPEFDAFLFAQVGDDISDLPLTVVSVLARLDFDPWQEAAQLAAVSPESATQKLISILGTLPSPSLKPSDIPLIASHLVAMLPGPTALLSPSLRDAPVAAGTALARSQANGLFLAIYLIVMISTELLMTHVPPTDAASRAVPPTTSAPSQMSTAPSGK
jgi:hypothetical protein